MTMVFQRRGSPAVLLRPLPWAVAVFLVGMGRVQAQAPAAAPLPAQAISLSEVTVSASGLQTGSADMATPVTVLEGDDWLLRREATLGEALKNEPGMAASHFGAAASRPIIRGMDGPRVKLLSDGAELHDASTVSPDHAVVSEPLLATQVEVLRGPSALVYGGGAVGGVVNVLDGKVPTAAPAKGYEGSAELRASSAARESAGAVALTGGSGPLVLHVEGAKRDASDYRVGSGWAGGRKVEGSFQGSDSGSVGLSWVGAEGYLGAAYTRHRANYGLPGHQHGIDGCEVEGYTLHCAAMAQRTARAATIGNTSFQPSAPAEEHHDVPVVDLRSERWDVRGEWRNPWAGISAVRLRAGRTDYRHDEVDQGQIATTFRNRAHDARLELQHLPVAGWRGVWGVETSQRQFSAVGEDAYIQPTDTRKNGLFALESYQWQQWRFEAALRHDRQTIRVQSDGRQSSHHSTSASLGAVWKFAPGYQWGASWAHASRLPTAEELYARGLHLATSTFEQGNAALRAETAHNIDISLRKTSGDTTASVGVFRNRIRDYIYGRTVNAVEGLQWLDYSQAHATFTGLEAQVRQRVSAQWGVTLWGDMVRARLDDGGLLPRIPAARWGTRLDAVWGGAWQGQLEWAQVVRQNRITAFETATPGYGMLNASVHYRSQIAGQPVQWYLKGQNLTNRLAYAHTSFIKQAAPLAGRNLSVGVRVDF